MSDYISKDTPLQRLSLKGNKLNDSDALQIAQALKKNCNLMWLNLESNEITNDGYSIIRRTFWSDDLTFNELYHCNHVCCLKPYADQNSMISNSSRSNKGFHCYSISEARALGAKDSLSRKIVETFKNKISDNSLLPGLQSEFGKDAFKLAPYILKSIRYYYIDYWVSICYRWDADGKGALGAYFEMIRGWIMPEMYDRGTKHVERV